mmetsp:Transcript_7232/g.22078  ORF Transcript_7232/g.22078 Transcript_7232/m.22078 type:complete len:212 (-) Transcript_7232:376-1011(-)
MGATHCSRVLAAGTIRQLRVCSHPAVAPPAGRHRRQPQHCRTPWPSEPGAARSSEAALPAVPRRETEGQTLPGAERQGSAAPRPQTPRWRGPGACAGRCRSFSSWPARRSNRAARGCRRLQWSQRGCQSPRTSSRLTPFGSDPGRVAQAGHETRPAKRPCDPPNGGTSRPARRGRGQDGRGRACGPGGVAPRPMRRPTACRKRLLEAALPA